MAGYCRIPVKSGTRAATFLFVLAGILWGAPIQAQMNESSLDTDDVLDAITAHVRDGLQEYPPDPSRIPRTLEPDGSVKGVPPRDWTSGFFPGILWQLQAVSGDTSLRHAAESWTNLLDEESRVARDHDIGFRIYCSYGLGWELTRDTTYREAVLRAAEALTHRFNPIVGAIKSWEGDWGGWEYPVIIDNMMNLELLFAATRFGGDSTFSQIAVQHAETTMRDHFRDDGSSYHVIDYDPATGMVKQRQTHQGAADESAWARGQSWGLYGFTMTYRETQDPKFLDRARRIADFVLNHHDLPNDGVPYWDYDAPGIPETNRDASAAAIMASALYELQEFVPESAANRYIDAADRMIESLWHDYPAPDGAWPFVLGESVGNMNVVSEVGVPIIYADYYFIEALRRRRALSSRAE